MITVFKVYLCVFVISLFLFIMLHIRHGKMCNRLEANYSNIRRYYNINVVLKLIMTFDSIIAVCTAFVIFVFKGV